MDWPSIDDLIRLIASVSETELALVAFLAIVLAYLAVHVTKGKEVPIWAKITVFIVVALLVFVGMLLVLGDESPPRPASDDRVHYAYYGIGLRQRPTTGGELRVFNSLDPQPDFEAVVEGVVLVAVSTKNLHALPTANSDETGEVAGGTCLRVVAGQRVPVVPPERPPEVRSAGYLPVRIIECPAR